MIATFFIIFALLFRGIRRKNIKQPILLSTDDINNSVSLSSASSALLAIGGCSDETTANTSLSLSSDNNKLIRNIDDRCSSEQEQEPDEEIVESRISKLSDIGKKFSYDKISLFSRSDSTITSTSIDPYPHRQKRGDSTASSTSISTSYCSEVLLPDGRRSSEGTRVGGHRKSSGRIRRYGTRITNVGGRRRTTGR